MGGNGRDSLGWHCTRCVSPEGPEFTADRTHEFKLSSACTAHGAEVPFRPCFLPPLPLAQARPCLSTEWALNRCF